MDCAEVMAELEGLKEEEVRAQNARSGDRHAVKLSPLRALAKRLKKDQPLAEALWATGDPDARLLTTLICRPKAFSAEALDGMLREVDFPKLRSWLVSYVVASSKHAEALRRRWKDDPDDTVGAAGWSLTVTRVVKAPEDLDLAALLDQIEAEMKSAPTQTQWAMNHCLAEIGIHHPEHRARAIAIGERLQVLADYPASPGCTPPFAPIWIEEMVRRQGAAG